MEASCKRAGEFARWFWRQSQDIDSQHEASWRRVIADACEGLVVKGVISRQVEDVPTISIMTFCCFKMRFLPGTVLVLAFAQ
uniref:Uncharacterized protein n=1 Tax=Parascaris equorum TaxID=6256 RepID=A0A914R3I9_PAREQ